MKHIFLIIILVLLLGFAPFGHATETPTECQVKAAYLYNFAKFIHWPDSVYNDAKAPLVIGVLGENYLEHCNL